MSDVRVAIHQPTFARVERGVMKQAELNAYSLGLSRAYDGVMAHQPKLMFRTKGKIAELATCSPTSRQPSMYRRIAQAAAIATAMPLSSKAKPGLVRTELPPHHLPLRTHNRG